MKKLRGEAFDSGRTIHTPAYARWCAKQKVRKCKADQRAKAKSRIRAKAQMVAFNPYHPLRRGAVRAAQARLRTIGYTITHDWTQEDAAGMVGAVLENYLRRAADADVEGVRTADLVFMLDHPKMAGGYAEAGMATVLEIPTIVVKHPDVKPMIFYHRSNVKMVDTLEEGFVEAAALYRLLKKYEEGRAAVVRW